MPHDAAAYLDYLRRVGAPAVSAAAPATPEELQAAADKGPHPSALAHKEFLWGEAFEMCQRRHTMVLPLSAATKIKGARVSPQGVIPQPDRWARTISNLTASGVNANTVRLAPTELMQFG